MRLGVGERRHRGLDQRARYESERRVQHRRLNHVAHGLQGHCLQAVSRVIEKNLTSLRASERARNRQP